MLHDDYQCDIVHRYHNYMDQYIFHLNILHDTNNLNFVYIQDDHILLVDYHGNHLNSNICLDVRSPSDSMHFDRIEFVDMYQRNFD